MGSLLYGTAQHIREQSKIDARRITRASGNEKRGAESALARFSASLSNQRALDAAGTQVGNISENIARNLDAAVTGTLSSRIAAAEELGASAVNAAAAGVGGSSVETYNATLRLSQAMQEDAALRGVDSDNIAASRARGAAITDAVASLDNNVYLAEQDYTIDVDHHKQGLLGKLFTVGVAAAATSFGGPKAGMAVIKLNEANQAAKNGDFGTASQEATGALRSGLSAASDFNKTRGKSSSDAPAGGRWSSVVSTGQRVTLGTYTPKTLR